MLDDANTRKITNARNDARTAARELQSALEASTDADIAYHVAQAISRCEFALTALRATQKAA